MISTSVRHGVFGLLFVSGVITGCAGASNAQKPLAAQDQPSQTVAAASPTSSGLVEAPKPLFVPPLARQAVIDARQAMEKKNWPEVEALIAVAQDDPLLGSYPEYWWLRQQVQNPARPIPLERLQRFLAQTSNQNLADRLQMDWIIAATRSGDYARALDLASRTQTQIAASRCAVLHARYKTGEKVSEEQALDVFAPGLSCWSMLDELAVQGILSWKALAFKLRAILETNHLGNARRMAAVLFDGAQMRHYSALIENPKKWLQTQSTPRSQAEIELVTLALARLARNKNRDADGQYIANNWAKRLPKENLEWVYSQFGLIAALGVESDAASWYRKSGTQRLTDYNHAWEVRVELRGHPVNWKRVQASISRMTPRQASEPVWTYWKGRALQAQGQEDAARQHYLAIANELDFYGQLANEQLGNLPFVPVRPTPVSATELAHVQANKGLQRAIALFDLGWRPEATQEWVFAVRNMDDRSLLAAAEFARKEHVYDRVVNTSLLTRNEIDFSQRFVAPFEGRVTAKAKEINLDPAWVYGLIRQESRFMTDARSRVGASGLMQLMPATARWVAKKIGLDNFNPNSVNDFDTNTLLGTHYLRIVLDQLDGSEVLASAGYNAGPGRPKQWRARLAAPVEGAIFAETIPFTETRLYVKNVMSNAVYYSMVFSGQPQSLKQRLGTVSPK